MEVRRTMGGRSILAWLGLALVAWLFGQPAARADEAALSWVRLPGAEDCIAAPELARLVEERIGRPVLQAPSRADVSIEGRVGQDGDGWLAVVDVSDRRGGHLGRRELRVSGEPCSALDRPAALIISVLIDREAAGPALLRGNELSPDAQRLLAQLNLPSAKPDEVLALIVGEPARAATRAQPANAKRSASERARPSRKAPPAKTVSVPEAEWRRMQALAAEASSDRAGTPAWPGYALLGLSAAATGAAIYAFVRVGDLNDDPTLEHYRAQMAATLVVAMFSDPRGGQLDTESMVLETDACDAAANGATFGLSGREIEHVNDVCGEGKLLEALSWVFVGTALASAATGGAWLLWVADDGAGDRRDTGRARAVSPSLSLAPAVARDFAGLDMSLRL
jgi:hypothetical protein